MIKTLYVMSVLTLSGAGALLVLSATQWRQGDKPGGIDPGPSATERFLTRREVGGPSGPDTVAPLLREAEALARYLNPPTPTPPLARPTPPRAANPQPVYQPPTATPWFSLLATSYNRLHPEQSWALISEPGKDGRWARQGERLGHFIIESVEDKGRIVYRDGNQSREMSITIRETIPIARLKSSIPVSTQNLPSDGRPVVRSVAQGL
jgi:hypothetical protein